MKKKIISLLIIIFSLISFRAYSSEQNWKPAQDGDKIILIRHAKAPGGGDPEGFNIEDCKTQRNLDIMGINQSKKIGKLFREKKIKIDKVLSSQWCRCKDTAKYAFEDFKEFSALNSTYTSPYDQNEKQQIKELKKYVSSWKGNGGNLVLVTHYVIILAITGKTARSGELVITDKNFKILSTINTL
jgi:phosphohistidine phosphatase SixA|tara:strand:+ start:51 stop:608 length:558 start_codon:yes stop_codon:yes gene_type:complete